MRPSALAACLGNGLIAGGAPIAIETRVVMHITGTNISAALKRHAERSLRTMLGEELKRVVAIDVELSGEDRRHTTDRNVCAIRAVLQRAGVVFVHGRSTDAATAVDRAGSRLKTALAAWPASRTYGRFDSAS